MPTHKTSAWPLSLVYAGLVVYASLYPFAGWRDQGLLPLEFLLASWPAYWTTFDVLANALGYAPLGFLLALAALRTGHGRHATLGAALSAGGLSLLLETAQSYLPARVPSNLDFVLNLGGSWLGAAVAVLLERLGAIDRWSRFRARWFAAESRGALVLLALWPFALLFPASVPLGLGQVFERVESGLARLLIDTPFLEWLPVRAVELQPLVPVAEMSCVSLGLLIPGLLGFGIIADMRRRAIFLAVLIAMGVLASSLSAALSYGPLHAWAWLSAPVKVGLGLAVTLSLLLLRVPVRLSLALLLVGLGVYLSLVNQAPASPYFAHNLQIWEQGRFIRFHGLGQWLGWVWPYVALAYVLVRYLHVDGQEQGDR